MKLFKVFLGGPDLLSTHEVTSKPEFQIVFDMVNKLRGRLLADPILRKPFLNIFSTVYSDDSKFPDRLKDETPLADQVPNKTKIQQFRTQPPCDDDVVTFLNDSFPDLYLKVGNFEEEDVVWGETFSGREEANKEEITINVRLVRAWFTARAALTTPGYSSIISEMELSVLFLAVFLHELAHSSLVWYGGGVCNSPKLGGIEEESGDYLEKMIFGGVSSCEIRRDDLQIMGIGFYKGYLYYPINKDQAESILKFDTSKSLPLLDSFTLSPSPEVPKSSFRAKLSLSRFRVKSNNEDTRAPINMDVKSSTHFFTKMKGDKKIRPPRTKN